MIAPRTDDGDDWLDDAFPLADGVAETEARIECPYCGAEAELALDPGGGPALSYVEDCEVCCRPWSLTVRWDADGAAHVEARTAEE